MEKQNNLDLRLTYKMNKSPISNNVIMNFNNKILIYKMIQDNKSEILRVYYKRKICN